MKHIIKRLLLAASLVAGTFLSSWADEQKKITLDNSDHKSETVELAYGNIFISLKDVDANDNWEISVEIENNDESNMLLLFEKAYDEKALKSLYPSITYDKVFGGSKGQRSIDNCPELKITTRIQSSEKISLFTLNSKNQASIVCRLPIYIAKNKNKSGSKMLLLAKDVVELVIEVQLKPDEEFISVTNDYESLIKDIDSEYFCTNKNHKGQSLKSLEAKYRKKINDLKSRIDDILTERGYYPQDKPYKKYDEISKKLAELLKFERRAVSKCPHDKLPPACKYCKMNYETIYKKFENYYIDIHNGKKNRAQVIDEVESIYKCVSGHKRKGSNSYKSRITDYYNKIKSLK